MFNGQLEKIIFEEIKRKIETNDSSLKIASLPEIILRINEVIADENKGICDIAEVVQTDAAVTTRLIRVSNSPALRGVNEVKNIKDAINRVGTSVVKNLVLCVMMIDRFQSSDPHEQKVLHRYLEQSAIHSTINFGITKYFTKLKPEPAIIIGLIHNVGHLVALSYMNDFYSGMTHDQIDNVVGTIGPEVGKLILQKWDFPDTLVNPAFSTRVAEPDLENIVTYTDAYSLAKQYIDNALPEEVQATIKEALDNHVKELDELRALFLG